MASMTSMDMRQAAGQPADIRTTTLPPFPPPYARLALAAPAASAACWRAGGGVRHVGGWVVERERLSQPEVLSPKIVRRLKGISNPATPSAWPPGKSQSPHQLWQPGQSGNPGGRRRKSKELAELCRLEDENNLRALCEIRDNQAEHGLTRIAAARTILEYGHGRPVPGTTIDKETGKMISPQVVVINGVDSTL
jgi:hypothetical protein